MISYKIVKLWKDHVYIPTGNINECAGLYDIHGPASIFKVSYILSFSLTLAGDDSKVALENIMKFPKHSSFQNSFILLKSTVSFFCWTG